MREIWIESEREMERDMDREREIDGDSNVYREIIRERQSHIDRD